jgi:hypothetical protein
LIGTFDARPADGEDRLDLPDDAVGPAEGEDGETGRPQGLHYAPLGVASIRRRMARLAAWVDAHDPVMMIVDVSVEIALLARLLSVPTIVVRLAGDRTDRPHLDAFQSAEKLLAPFPPALESAATPAWVRDKTIYAGFLGAPSTVRPQAAAPPRPTIVVVFGRGGGGGDVVALSAAARAMPAFAWDVLGPVRGARLDGPPNLRFSGWVDDVGSRLASASLVIGTGGDGVIAAVAAHGKRFICIPEQRPFAEQRVKADALHDMGAAIHHASWRGAVDWPRLIAAGLALDPSRLASLATPEATAKAASALDRIAADIDRRHRRGAPESA